MSETTSISERCCKLQMSTTDWAVPQDARASTPRLRHQGLRTLYCSGTLLKWHTTLNSSFADCFLVLLSTHTRGPYASPAGGMFRRPQAPSMALLLSMHTSLPNAITSETSCPVSHHSHFFPFRADLSNCHVRGCEVALSSQRLEFLLLGTFAVACGSPQSMFSNNFVTCYRSSGQLHVQNCAWACATNTTTITDRHRYRATHTCQARHREWALTKALGAVARLSPLSESSIDEVLPSLCRQRKGEHQ